MHSSSSPAWPTGGCSVRAWDGMLARARFPFPTQAKTSPCRSSTHDLLARKAIRAQGGNRVEQTSLGFPSAEPVQVPSIPEVAVMKC